LVKNIIKEKDEKGEIKAGVPSDENYLSKWKSREEYFNNIMNYSVDLSIGDTPNSYTPNFFIEILQQNKELIKTIKIVNEDMNKYFQMQKNLSHEVESLKLQYLKEKEFKKHKQFITKTNEIYININPEIKHNNTSLSFFDEKNNTYSPEQFPIKNSNENLLEKKKTTIGLFDKSQIQINEININFLGKINKDKVPINIIQHVLQDEIMSTKNIDKDIINPPE